MPCSWLDDWRPRLHRSYQRQASWIIEVLSGRGFSVPLADTVPAGHREPPEPSWRPVPTACRVSSATRSALIAAAAITPSAAAPMTLAEKIGDIPAVNLLLGAFTLVPAFPLDGGRVFRSIVWGVTHRSGRATAIAAIVGQGFGLLMIAPGRHARRFRRPVRRYAEHLPRLVPGSGGWRVA
jgi:peptidase M50-like protein